MVRSRPCVSSPRPTSRALARTTFDPPHHLSGSDNNAKLNWQTTLVTIGPPPSLEITLRRALDAMTFQHTVLHDDHILSRRLRDDHRLL